MTATGLLTAATGLVLAAGGGSASADPPGNNGTVKIAELGDIDTIPNNDPHVPCTFTVQWYNFDKGSDIVSTVSMSLQPPTTGTMTLGGPSTVFVGADAAGGAGNDFDGEATYTPTFNATPQPQQGFHVKLTVHTPGSKGADTKYKVFWVAPCQVTPSESVSPTPSKTPTQSPSPSKTPTQSPSLSPSMSPSVTPSESISPSPSMTTSAPPTTAPPTTAPPTTTPPTVKPSETVVPPTGGGVPPTVAGTQAGVPQAVEAGLASTGQSGHGLLPQLLMSLGFGLVAAGAVTALAPWRRRGTHQI